MDIIYLDILYIPRYMYTHICNTYINVEIFYCVMMYTWSIWIEKDILSKRIMKKCVFNNDYPTWWLLSGFFNCGATDTQTGILFIYVYKYIYKYIHISYYLPKQVLAKIDKEKKSPLKIRKTRNITVLKKFLVQF